MLKTTLVCDRCGKEGKSTEGDEVDSGCGYDLRSKGEYRGWSHDEDGDLCIDCRAKDWAKREGDKKTLYGHLGAGKDKFKAWLLEICNDCELMEIKDEAAESFFSQEADVVVGWWTSSAIVSWAKENHSVGMMMTSRAWQKMLENINGKSMADAEKYLVVTHGWPVDTKLKALLGGISEPTPDSVKYAVENVLLNKIRHQKKG